MYFLIQLLVVFVVIIFTFVVISVLIEKFFGEDEDKSTPVTKKDILMELDKLQMALKLAERNILRAQINMDHFKNKHAEYFV